MNYKGVKDQVHSCITCGTKFQRFQYRRKGITPKFCSNECQMKERWLQTIIRIERGSPANHNSHRRYLTEKFGYKCTCCSISEWMGTPLTLQVDHIDGNPDNNLPSNLRLLCPNCHSQTPTYKGGNKKNPKMDSRSIKIRGKYGARSRDRTWS